jgi:LAO/AO transport system kinase
MALAQVNEVKVRPSHETLVEPIRSGDIRAVSRIITLVENRHPDGLAALRVLGQGQHRAAVIGITGYPGAGKSTLTNGLIAAYRRLGKKVAVLAVDTSSPITGGAVLGDRVRMQDHAGDPEVYIRSMASRGYRGGLSRATSDAVIVLEAAGYEVILIETIGVGQNELDIVDVAQTVAMVVVPGLGDEVQAMKAGLLEIAHIVVVNKSDLAGADATVKDLREWCRVVIPATAVKGDGVVELVAAITEHQRSRDPFSSRKKHEQGS